MLADAYILLIFPYVILELNCIFLFLERNIDILDYDEDKLLEELRKAKEERDQSELECRRLQQEAKASRVRRMLAEIDAMKAHTQKNRERSNQYREEIRENDSHFTSIGINMTGN